MAGMAEQGNPEKLCTTGEVIDRLGGDAAVARLLGCNYTQTVWNWRERGLPPDTFYALTTILNQRGLYAPPSLWKMREAAAG